MLSLVFVEAFVFIGRRFFGFRIVSVPVEICSLDWSVTPKEGCGRGRKTALHAWASQNLATVRIFGDLLPPHPCPLPWGEGATTPGLLPANVLGFWNAASAVPSPWGEGQGEGKRDGLTCTAAIR